MLFLPQGLAFKVNFILMLFVKQIECSDYSTAEYLAGFILQVWHTCRINFVLIITGMLMCCISLGPK